MSSLYNKFKNFVNDKFVPLASKLSSSTVLQAVSYGLMYTLPLTLTASLFSLLANFPIQFVADAINNAGLVLHFDALMGGTLNIISIFIAFSIPYNYVKLKKEQKAQPLMAGFLSLAAFVILMPQTIGDVAGLSFDYLGSSGMFAAILLGILIPMLYCKLMLSDKLVLKMPKGIPPMVTQSFEPLLVAFIILVSIVILRIIFALTPIGSLFNLVNILIAQPLLSLGSSPLTMVIIALVANSLFFFGIHPNVVNTAIVPLLYTMVLTSIEQFQSGVDLTYKTSLITNSFTNNDAVGSTLSLLVAILIFGKSKRYRSLAKMAAVPNVFNINEPVIFGLPIVFNPIMFVPFILSTLITSFIGYMGAISGFIVTYNPVIALGLPWTTPKFIASFLSMGWQGLVLRILAFIVMIFVYMPFIKYLDKKEFIEEQAKK
ncbi:MAG: PTS sugar transporter subunit IIC [Erysipelotrichaceae bacterium]